MLDLLNSHVGPIRIWLRSPPCRGATFLLNKTWVASHLATAIKEASHRTDLVRYIMERDGWESPEIFDMIY